MSEEMTEMPVKRGRGRPKGSKNKNRGIGDNSKVLTEEQRNMLTTAYSEKRNRLVEIERKARSERAALDKEIRAELGRVGLQDVKTLNSLDSEEGEADFFETIQRYARLAKWAGIGVSIDVKEVTDIERIESEARRDASLQVGPSPSYDRGTAEYDAYMREYERIETTREIAEEEARDEVLAELNAEDAPEDEDKPLGPPLTDDQVAKIALTDDQVAKILQEPNLS